MLSLRWLLFVSLLKAGLGEGSSQNQRQGKLSWFDTSSGLDLEWYLSALLQQSDRIFQYKLYTSPDSAGITYTKAKSLCEELGFSPAVILSKEEYSQVLSLLLEADLRDVWTGLTLFDERGLVWDLGNSTYLQADTFYTHNLDATQFKDPNEGSVNRRSATKRQTNITLVEPDSGEVEAQVDPGTTQNGTESELHFTLLSIGDYWPQNTDYLAGGFVCANFTGGASNSNPENATDQANGIDWRETMLQSPESVQIYTLNVSNETGYEEASLSCTSQGFLPAVILTEELQQQVMRVLAASNQQTAWIGLKSFSGRFVWADTGIDASQYYPNNLQAIFSETGTTIVEANFMVTSEGLWKQVPVGETTGSGSIICFSRDSYTPMPIDSTDIQSQSPELWKNFVSWIFDYDLYGVIETHVIRGEGITLDEIGQICEENGYDNAYLLTEGKNIQATEVLVSQQLSEAWITLGFSQSEQSFTWGDGEFISDASQFYMNNLDPGYCTTCDPDALYSPVVLQENGNWRAVGDDHVTDSVVCMDSFEDNANIGNFLLETVPQSLQFTAAFKEYPIPWAKAHELCDNEYGLTFLAPVSSQYYIDMYREFQSSRSDFNTGQVEQSYAWVGINFTRSELRTSAFNTFVSFETNVIDSWQTARVIDSITNGDIESAPVAVSSEGYFVLMDPSTTLNAYICTSVNVDLTYPNSTDGEPVDPYNVPSLMAIPAISEEGMTFEEAEMTCANSLGSLAVIMDEYRNDMAKMVIESSGLDNVFIGLTYNGTQYRWKYLDLVLYDGYFLNNIDLSQTSESGARLIVMTNEGLWKPVETTYRAPGVLCDVYRDSDHNEHNYNDPFYFTQSHWFRAAFYHWVIDEYFDFIEIDIVQTNGTGYITDGQHLCTDRTTTAFILTEAINTEATGLLRSMDINDAWIGLFYNSSVNKFYWGSEPSTDFYGIDSSGFFMNNLQSFECPYCGSDSLLKPVVLQSDGQWRVVNETFATNHVVCMGFPENVEEGINLFAFFALKYPQSWEFSVIEKPGSQFDWNLCPFEGEGFTLSGPAAIVSSYHENAALERLREFSDDPPMLAWTGVEYTKTGFIAGTPDSMSTNVTFDVAVTEESRSLMKSVDIGELEYLPTAISSDGSWHVLTPDTELDAVICSIFNPDAIDPHSIDPHPIDIVRAAMSLFNAMRALKALGNMQAHKEVIMKTPLTTTIEGPANSVPEIPEPHGIPMSMELYEKEDLDFNEEELNEPEGEDLSVDIISFPMKNTWKKQLPPPDHALLGISNLVFMPTKSTKPSDYAGPVTNIDKKEMFDSEWQNTEVNLNHLDVEADRNRINALKEAYSDPCKFFDHEICSINLKKAILYQSKSLVKIIVRAHCIAFLENPRALPVIRDKSTIVNMMDAFRVTPLMIAARVGNFKIVKVLLEYGADPTLVTSSGDTALSIAAKHHDERMIELLIDYGADIGVALCMVGLSRPSLYKNRDVDMLNAPTLGLSHYGFSFEPVLTLSQPKFLLRTRNPIYEAFKVGTIINKIGDKKDEYLGDCELLESQTDDFAYHYLDQCRTMWEALLLLHDQQLNDQNRDLLKYALKKKKMKFISHHFCQQYIMDLWYGGVQRGRVRNTMKKLGRLFVIHVFMPVFIIAGISSLVKGLRLVEYTTLTNTSVMSTWNKLHVPVVSYVVDLFNFFVLCSVMIWTCMTITDNYRDTSPAEILLWMCLAARFMVELDKMRTQGRNFFKHVGNVVDLAVSCCIILTVLLRIVAYVGVFDENSQLLDRFPLWSSYIYATAFLGLMLRMLEMLDITYTLGPLEGAIGKMMKDVIKVCLLLILCILGFSVSMWTITLQSYHYERVMYQKYLVNNITYSRHSQDPEFPELFNSYNTTLVSLVWSTFGLIDPDGVTIGYNRYADSYLKFLWGVYILTAMILFLNMLIAMLTETYVKVINNAETEWKYARSVIVHKYLGTHPFIFPFNMVLYPLSLIYHVAVERKKKRLSVKEKSEAEEEAIRQSGFLHRAIKKRFKKRFHSVLQIPYHYRSNIFDFYKTFPFQNETKKPGHNYKRRRMSTFRAPKRDSESSESDDNYGDSFDTFSNQG